MDTDKIIRDLEIKDDINNLTEKELIEKYGKTKEDAMYFMYTFYDAIQYHLFYPTVIYNEYKKIKDVLKELNEEHSKGTDFENLYNSIMRRLGKEDTVLKNWDDKIDFETQMYYTKELQLGITEYGIKFNDLNKIALNTTKRLTEAYNDNPRFPNKYEYTNVLRQAEKIGLTKDPMEEIAIISKYQDEFPLLDLCHDEEALVGINYLLTDTGFDYKRELSAIALNIIDFSLSFNPIGKDFDKKGYRQIAKATINIIKEKNKDLLDKNTKKLYKKK